MDKFNIKDESEEASSNSEKKITKENILLPQI
jgi:hypothetical protein